jgi:hypothetical protein
MKAGGAQFGSTSFTFFVRRILAPMAFGAQLCATGAVTADAGGLAQTTRPSEQMREQLIARTMRSPPPPLGPLWCPLARSEGFEPPTPRFEVWCSIQLSYERTEWF